MARLNLLTFTTLFPNAEQPNHGVFVENRLRHLLARHDVASTVVAPVPWWPLGARGPATWQRHARVPAREERHGLTVHHPRFPSVPRVGMAPAPALLFAAAARAIRRLVAEGLEFDVIDAHYLYPDGVAAVWLGQLFGRPVVLTARGSDVTQFPDHAVPRRLIRSAMRRADGLIAVSGALAERMEALGAAPGSVQVLRNGVDLAAFRPYDRVAARAALGLTRPTLLSVGHLIERKGHDLAIGALRWLPGCELLVAGEGPAREALLAQARAQGVADRVRLLGSVPHGELAPLYSAADALVLASSREGWANVLLESMACGTPVVASDIPGMAEVVRAPAAGRLVARTAEAIAAGAGALLAEQPQRERTRHYAEAFGWDETSDGQAALFRRMPCVPA